MGERVDGGDDHPETLISHWRTIAPPEAIENGQNYAHENNRGANRGGAFQTVLTT